MEVTVEYDYTAQEPDELTIRKGDIIKDVIKHPGGWWEGVLSDKKGMFPDNFVRPVDKEPSLVTLRNKKDVARIRQCRVVFSYNQNHEDELSLKVGDVIDIIGDEEEGWWRGILHGKEGVFPSNFVEEILNTAKPKPSSRESTELSKVSSEFVPSLPAKPSKQYCEVKYGYKAQNEDELSLNEGDIVTLISKDGQDQGWWKGELNGKVGVFPDNFVVLRSSLDEKFSSDEKKLLRSTADAPGGVKPSSQRKSLEIKPDRTSTGSVEIKNATPPVPGKKPVISIKKSPSGSGGIFSEIRKKIVDVVDGATASKSIKTDHVMITNVETYSKIETNNNENIGENNVFDQVERRPLLRDVRANRAKAPGRRLPTSIYKEDDDVIGIPNGTTTSSEHLMLHNLTYETTIETSNTSTSSITSSSDLESFVEGNKPKLREWEKHKAPWLAEMKLNQAKRTSTSPGPENRLKLTSTNATVEPEESKSAKNSPSSENKESSPVSDNLMSKSMSVLSTSTPKLQKTPPNDLETREITPRQAPIVKAKPSLPPPSSATSPPNKLAAPLQPTKAHPPSLPTNKNTPALVDREKHSHNKDMTPPPVQSKVSPVVANKMRVGVTEEQVGGGDHFGHASKFEEVLERVRKLENVVEKQGELIEELKNKLQIESDMRIMLQEKLLRDENDLQL